MSKARILLAAAILGVLYITGASAQDEGIPNHIALAKVGEWAKYAMPNGYVQTHTVISREGEGPTAIIKVKVENIYNGQVVETKELTHEAGEPINPTDTDPGPGVTMEVSYEDVTVKGKTIRATVVELEREDGDDVEWQLSNEIPVFGMIRQETDGDEDYLLVDYGFAP